MFGAIVNREYSPQRAAYSPAHAHPLTHPPRSQPRPGQADCLPGAPAFQALTPHALTTNRPHRRPKRCPSTSAATASTTTVRVLRVRARRCADPPSCFSLPPPQNTIQQVPTSPFSVSPLSAPTSSSSNTCAYVVPFGLADLER